MDAVELARQRAAELHFQAVQRGGDPWKPYEFAIAEAKHHGYDVEDLTPGASMLDGGRAKLLPSGELILHERKGTPFERALLVAHEIGHALLGDADDSTPAKDVDFSRPAEVSPVGEERVVDYGRRQRREIQMDLFARELLIPRSHVRALHLDQALGARDIATKLDAPYEVVAQQLLDALLLPEVHLAQSEAKEYDLNTSQRTAANHRGCAFLVSAGPGTGKTQTLVARVEGLLQEGVDPRRILLLTFSNKAAGEMADRIAARQPDAAAALWVGTFHAFGLDIVRRFHDSIGLPKDPRMIDRTEAVELLEYEFPRLALQHYQNLYDPTQVIYDMLSAISRGKDEVVGPAQYMQLAEGMRAAATADEDKLAAEKAVEVARVYEAYEQLKRERKYLDFGDLVYLPVKLLEGNDAVRSHLAAAYDHILVDEYQDVNRSSVRLLKALRPSGENLWVVGDAKQSIYRFRGASSFNVSGFGKTDFPDGQVCKLDTNYRSVPTIVKAYSAFAQQMRSGGSESELEPNREDIEHALEFRLTPGADEQTVAIADCIEELKAQGVAYRDQAVLCTGNEKLANLGRDLESLGVPVLFLGSLFERPEVKDLLAVSSLLVDPRAMGLVRVACLPAYQMPISDVAAVLRHLRAAKAQPLAFLSMVDIPGLSTEGQAVLEQLQVLFSGFSASDPPWLVLASVLLDRTRMSAEINTAQTVSSRAKGIAIWQFMNFVRVQPSGSGLPVFRLQERIRRLLRLGDERDLRQLPAAAQSIDAVRLMTIHGAKGLEFAAVHLPGLNEDTLPGYRQKSPACPLPIGMIQGASGSVQDYLESTRLEEKECLFYVALSRAKDKLQLYAAAANKGGRQRKLSEGYLTRLGEGLVRSSVTPARPLPPAAEDAPVPLHLEGSLRFEAHQIEAFERCPRRFFYTYVLQTGGKRTVTPFMQMHDGVRKLFKKVVAGELNSSGTQLVADVTQALCDEGLQEHGYFDHYRDFAIAMIEFFSSTRKGFQSKEPQALRVQYGGEEIVVTPDDVLVGEDGSITVRRVSTGHSRSEDGKSIGAAAFLAAASEAFSGAKVELVYLADQKFLPLALKAGEMETRRRHMETHLGGIRAGQFVANPSSFSCPNCPALFICGPVPQGTLSPLFTTPVAASPTSVNLASG